MLTRRHFVAVAATLIAIWAVVSMALWRRQRDRVLADFEGRAESFVARLQLEIAEAARAGREDVSLLSESSAADAFRRHDLDATPMLQERFLDYIRSRTRAFQVRLIGADGLERIRVERRGDGASIASELQDKSDRHYFVRASRLPSGEVYISPIDLNLEHGRVEQPPRPTIRYAAPIYDVAGELLAVVVINWDATPLFERFERARGQIAGTLVLVHPDGVYAQPDSGRRLDQDYPEVGAWLATGEGATYRDDDVIAARGDPPEGTALPRPLLITSESDALAAGGGGLLGLTIGIAASEVGIAVCLFLVWRHQRLVDQLRRESELREEIATREARLKEAHERLVASARLAALAESAAALAHEVRNPLGAIVNSAAQLTDEPALDDDGRKLMQIVLEESERLERAVADFLALARRRPPQLSRVDLQEAARDVVELARRDPTLEGAVDIVHDLDVDTPEVVADPDELRQVLWNLLLNAGKATRRAGGKRVDVRVFPRGRAAVLEVRDEGPGLANGDDSSQVAARQTGTGLGLIVAAGIVARYGAEFQLQSRSDRVGARARVVFSSAQEAS